MTPLTFQPILKRIRWGGTRLGSVLGKPLESYSDYAESWEISDHGADQSRVEENLSVDQVYQDWPLNRLVKERAEELFGVQAHKFHQFPLLVKFLDAKDCLSLQVHPNDQQAVLFDPNENGKTEAWVILESGPESRIYAGLKAGVDHEMLRSCLPEGGKPPQNDIEDCLHSFSVSPGDCVYIPAGTVHAIGAGILLAEIQQSSDLTFRLHDWGYLDEEGDPREIHIKKALQCTDFQRGPIQPCLPKIIPGVDHQVEELVRSDFFVILRHRVEQPVQILTAGRFRIFLVLEGAGTFLAKNWQQDFRKGQTCLLPASTTEVTVRPQTTMGILEVFIE